MGIFGWSLPPGCGQLPGEADDEPVDLSRLIPGLAEGVHVYWAEDGALILLESDGTQSTLQTVPWDDTMDEDANLLHAAETAYHWLAIGATSLDSPQRLNPTEHSLDSPEGEHDGEE